MTFAESLVIRFIDQIKILKSWQRMSQSKAIVNRNEKIKTILILNL
jgi:hypothetical protein